MAGDQWDHERTEWLRRFHRDRRAGLDGPVGEATWPVSVDGAVVGSVRLQRTAKAAVLETGIWLTRRARGREEPQAGDLGLNCWWAILGSNQ